MRRFASVTLIACSFACASAPPPEPVKSAPVEAVKPAEDVLPSPEQLFEKYAKAIGGRARIERGKSYRAKGTLSVTEQGIEGALTLFMAAPNKALTILEMPGFGEVREGFDGKVGWSTDPMSGPRLKSGDELRDLERRSELHYALDYAKFYKSMKTTGRRLFGDQSCYRAELLTQDGREEVLYFDAESGLLVGREAMTPTAIGEVRFVSHYEEYRNFDGLLHPVKVRQIQGGVANVISLSEIEENPTELPDFEAPKEVKALLDEAEE